MKKWTIVLILSLCTVATAQRRVSIQKSTGIIIEAQDMRSREGSLIQNAVNGGIPKNDVIEKLVTADEYAQLQAARDALDPPARPSEIAVLKAEVATLKSQMENLQAVLRKAGLIP